MTEARGIFSGVFSGTVRVAILATLPILAAGIGLSSCAPKGSDRDSLHGRDLILVTVDTLRADAVGAYRDAGDGEGDTSPTPTIDELAARGLVFTQALAPMPRTTPSLASLLSGLSPQSHGSREVGQAMSGDVPILSQVLRDPGAFRAEAAASETATNRPSPYLNLAVTASRAAGRDHGLARGFHAFRLVHGDEPQAEEVTDLALQVLENWLGEPENADRPLFLWVHYLDPHFPYGTAKDPADACTEVIKTAWRGLALAHLDHDGVSSRGLEDCTRRYHEEAAQTDRAIGRLFDALRQVGRPPEEALVVFTADHGEHLGEAGIFYEHGPSLHDAALRVPLVVAGPGIQTGRSDRLVLLQDLMPTLLELLGVRPDAVPSTDGDSLAERWLGWQRDPVHDDRVVFFESNSALRHRFWRAVVAGRPEKHCTHHGRWSLCGAGSDFASFQLFDHQSDPVLEVDLRQQHPDVVARLLEQRQTWPPETARERGVRTARFKLVETPRPAGGYERRLYDLRSDAAESTDVSAQHPEVAQRLGRKLDEWVAELPKPVELERGEEELEALRALGYVE